MRSFFPMISIVLVAGLIAIPGSAGEPRLQPVSLPAFPAQLPPGKKPGTFQYSEGILARFYQKAEFPFDCVIQDYANQEVYRCEITSAAAHILTCDLEPGSYQVRFRMKGQAQREYSDADGTRFYISAEGRRGVLSGRELEYRSYPAMKEELEPTTIFIRKIQRLEPEPGAVVTGKSVTFRWAPIPGIKTYTFEIWPVQHPQHPKSIYAANRQSYLVKGTRLTIPIGLQLDLPSLKPAEAYLWGVYNGDRIEGEGGRLARGTGAFSTTGAEEEFRKTAQDNFMQDEAVEPIMGVRLRQPYVSSDVPFLDYITVEAVGFPLAAFKAGLLPGDRIVSFDGKPTPTLNQFHRALAEAPSGKSVSVEVEVLGQSSKRVYQISVP